MLLCIPQSLSAVTDVLVHPRRLDTILSSSADGTVRSFDSAYNASRAPYSNALSVYGAQQSDELYRVLCSEPGAIVSMDSDNSSDACMLLAVASTGSATRIAI